MKLLTVLLALILLVLVGVLFISGAALSLTVGFVGTQASVGTVTMQAQAAHFTQMAEDSDQLHTRTVQLEQGTVTP